MPGVSTRISDEALSAYSLTGKAIESYNTESNNTGISYYQTQSITISQDRILYAN